MYSDLNLDLQEPVIEDVAAGTPGRRQSRAFLAR